MARILNRPLITWLAASLTFAAGCHSHHCGHSFCEPPVQQLLPPPTWFQGQWRGMGMACPESVMPADHPAWPAGEALPPADAVPEAPAELPSEVDTAESPIDEYGADQYGEVVTASAESWDERNRY